MNLEASHSPTILALPPGPDAWRIDWFGNVAFPDRMVRRKQPSIFVQFSRVVDDAYLTDPSVMLESKTTSHALHQRGSWVSVGTLSLLRIGDIWQDQKLVLQPDYQLEQFNDLQIDGTTVKLIKAGLSPNDQGFLLPLSEHPWHRRSTQSYCLEIAILDNKRIIIPCVELIRFYFGSSSSLLTKLFLPPLSKDQLYDDAHFDRIKEHLSIELANRISGASAADIGRLHLSPQAWRAALTVGTSLLKCTASGEEIHPQAFFPFEGKTKLIAAGKWLSYAGDANATFVVFNLRSCSHPFPFKSLKYTLKDGDPYKTKMRVAGAGQEPPNTRHAPASPTRNLAEQDPSNSLRNKTWIFHAKPRFPDLAFKSIWRNRDIVGADSQRNVAAEKPKEVGAGATGEGASDRRVRSIDLAVALASDRPPPEFLLEFIEELQRHHAGQITLLTASEEDGWTVPVPLVCNEDGEIDERLFCNESDKISPLRRLAALALSESNAKKILVVIEASPIWSKLYKTRQLNMTTSYESLVVEEFLASIIVVDFRE